MIEKWHFYILPTGCSGGTSLKKLAFEQRPKKRWECGWNQLSPFWGLSVAGSWMSKCTRSGKGSSLSWWRSSREASRLQEVREGRGEGN